MHCIRAYLHPYIYIYRTAGVYNTYTVLFTMQCLIPSHILYNYKTDTYACKSCCFLNLLTTFPYYILQDV